MESTEPTVTTKVPLGEVKTYGTLSGYVYLHIPSNIVKQFNIQPSTSFSIIYRDGLIIFEQKQS